MMRLHLQVISITIFCLILPIKASLSSLDARADIEPSRPIVKVKNGTYAGVHNDHYNIDYFLGLPFAQPPVGDLRLALPQSLNTSFSEIRNATDLQPSCVQFSAITIDRPISEDCLTLNVYRPSGFEKAKLPVLVWIYGGGWIQGSNSDPRHNLTFMVNNSVKMNKPIIAVSINYRLNGFGFLGGPDVREKGLGNLGYRDQRLALHWIQENIEFFGGDPSKVTIWGQSAGGFSVGSHLLAFGGRNDSLFRAVIANSGGPLSALIPESSQLQSWNEILNGTECSSASDSLHCLRGLSSEKYIAAVNSTKGRFGPILDGEYFDSLNSKQLEEGRFVKVPFLTGANTDEGSHFAGDRDYVGGLPTVAYPDEASFLKVLNDSIINKTATPVALEVLSALYPDIPAVGVPHTHHGRLNSTFGAQYARVASFNGDLVIHRARRFSAQIWAKHDVPIYSYLYDQWPIGGLSDSTGASHFTEMQLINDNELGDGYLSPWYPSGSEFAGQNKDFTALARLMSRMWISFAHNLDPNAHGIGKYDGTKIPQWPTYTSNESAADTGYGNNLRLLSSLPGLCTVEPDIYRAEAIDYLIKNVETIFGN